MKKKKGINEVNIEVLKAGIKTAIDLSELGRKTGRQSLKESAAKVAKATAKGDTKEIFKSVIEAE